MDSGGALLDVRGLRKVFGSGHTEVRAVDGIDFQARSGEIVLIMGPSGSGKTTLLTMIGGLLRPTFGSVCIDGEDITQLSESRLTAFRRHCLGFVFQNFQLLDSLNARENVEAALNFAGVGGKRARTKADRLLSELGLEDRLKAKPKTLSGGERQRVSIARALANDPELILADEPTANLDSHHGHEVVELLRDIATQQKRTIVIVSHDHRIRDVADRVLWLQDGRFQDIDGIDARYMPRISEPVQFARRPTQPARSGILRSATSLLSWVQQQTLDQLDQRSDRPDENRKER